MRGRSAILVTFICLTACAGPVLRPSLPLRAQGRDALLVLPGFGYGSGDDKPFRSLAASIAGEGIDLYVASYITRSGLGASRAKLERFIRDNHLDRYRRLHVFAFLAGAWTINPLVERHALPNLATLIYDRSPYQERAPEIAAARLHFLTWVRYGSTVFDMAGTSYPALSEPDVRFALVVETTPTSFIRHHANAARQYGPFEFGCDSFHQRYDDCIYVPLNHNELYARFADVWPELRTFIQTGNFTAAANRMPPRDDALARGRRR